MPTKSTPHLDEFGNPRFRPDPEPEQPPPSPAPPKTTRTDRHWALRKSSPGQPGLHEPGHPLYPPAPPKTPSMIHHRSTQTKRPRLEEKGTSPSSPSSRRHSPPRYANRYSPLADDADDEDSIDPAPPRMFQSIATGPPRQPHDPTHCRCSGATEECVNQDRSS
jgi:hypothetical protein